MTILQGLTKDSGLFMLSYIPQLDVPLEKLASMTYQETACKVMKLFLIDYAEKELRDYIARTYNSKSGIEGITPLAKVDEAYYLELYHGGTIAFKDMALSILPHLMTTAARKDHVDREIAILTAIPGDMGKTAMTGFTDVPGTRIIVFYPKDGVNKVQEFQMYIQKRDNTSVVAIHDNFNDAQTDVKKMFEDKGLEAELMGKGFQFSSANSINIGCLVPQIVYYVCTYAKLLEAGEIEEGRDINVMAPTGNFDNIPAVYFIRRMGLPAKTLVCTSDDNKVLYDSSTTGIYDRKRELILTNSPPMDVPMSSNLERLIYMSTECDTPADGDLTRGLSQGKRYEATPEMCVFVSGFVEGFATQEQNAATIRELFDDTGYFTGTHTDVAASVYGNYRKESRDGTKTAIALATSPHGFPHSIMEVVVGREGLEDKDEFEVVDVLSVPSDIAVFQVVEEIRHAAARHNRECGVDDIENEVKDILGVS